MSFSKRTKPIEADWTGKGEALIKVRHLEKRNKLFMENQLNDGVLWENAPQSTCSRT